MFATCERPVVAGTSKTCIPSLSSADALGCTDSLVMASFEERDLIPEQEGIATDDQARSNLRFLSLRVPIYERLVREIDDRLKQLPLDSRASHHVSSEYISELEFLQAGLANAVDRLAIEHGVHWRNDVVEVRAPQRYEVSSSVHSTVTSSAPVARVATSLY